MVLLPVSETSFLFCNDLICLWLESVYDDLQHGLTMMADKADGSVSVAQLYLAFLWESDNQRTTGPVSLT